MEAIEYDWTHQYIVAAQIHPVFPSRPNCQPLSLGQQAVNSKEKARLSEVLIH